MKESNAPMKTPTHLLLNITNVMNQSNDIIEVKILFLGKNPINVTKY
jgi:hypothetical protein